MWKASETSLGRPTIAPNKIIRFEFIDWWQIKKFCSNSKVDEEDKIFFYIVYLREMLELFSIFSFVPLDRLHLLEFVCVSKAFLNPKLQADLFKWIVI